MSALALSIQHVNNKTAHSKEQEKNKKKQPNKIQDNKEGEPRNILMYIKGLAYPFSDVLRLHHIPPFLVEKASWIEFPVLFLLH